MRLTPEAKSADERVTRAEPPLDPVLTENALCDRYADAAPGDAIPYHLGLLARDRDRLASSLPPDARAELDAVARRALAMAEAGLGDLVQRRVAPGCFAYLLVVRRRRRISASPSGRLSPRQREGA